MSRPRTGGRKERGQPCPRGHVAWTGNSRAKLPALRSLISAQRIAPPLKSFNRHPRFDGLAGFRAADGQPMTALLQQGERALGSRQTRERIALPFHRPSAFGLKPNPSARSWQIWIEK